MASIGDLSKGFYGSGWMPRTLIRTPSVATVSCIYCDGPHLFDYCPYNPDSICYNGIPFDQGLTCSDPKAYSSEWRQHPLFSWGGDQATMWGGQQLDSHNFSLGFNQQQQQETHPPIPQLSSLETLLKESIAKMDTRLAKNDEYMAKMDKYMVENEVLIQSQATSLSNFEVQDEQLTSELWNEAQEVLPSEIENLRKSRKHSGTVTLDNGKDMNLVATRNKTKMEPPSNQIDKPSEGMKDAESETSKHMILLDQNASTKIEEPQAHHEFENPRDDEEKYGTTTMSKGKELNLTADSSKSTTEPTSIQKEEHNEERKGDTTAPSHLPNAVAEENATAEPRVVVAKQDAAAEPQQITEFVVPSPPFPQQFLATRRTLINEQKEELLMRVNDEKKDKGVESSSSLNVVPDQSGGVKFQQIRAPLQVDLSPDETDGCYAINILTSLAVDEFNKEMAKILHYKKIYRRLKMLSKRLKYRCSSLLTIIKVHHHGVASLQNATWSLEFKVKGEIESGEQNRRN